MWAGTFHSVCSAPGVDPDELQVLADVLMTGQSSAGQVPSQASGMTVTASPVDQPATPSPTLSIVPLVREPKISGVVTRASMAPWTTCRSVPHKPTKATRTCT